MTQRLGGGPRPPRKKYPGHGQRGQNRCPGQVRQYGLLLKQPGPAYERKQIDGRHDLPGVITSTPRKLFRKYLPSHQSIRENRYLKFFGTALQHHSLWHLHRRSVAGGVASGLFYGLVPWPLRMPSAAVWRHRIARQPAGCSDRDLIYQSVHDSAALLRPIQIGFVRYRVLCRRAHAPPNFFDLPITDWLPATATGSRTWASPLQPD